MTNFKTLQVVTLIATVALAAVAVANDRPVSVRLSPGPNGNEGIEIHGLSVEDLAWFSRNQGDASLLSSVFRVEVEQSSPAVAPAILGRYIVHDGAVRFEARYPLVPGVRYRVTFDPSRANSALVAKAITSQRLSLESTGRRQATFVTQVYPSAGVLPENLLKFYICFSAPMSLGQAYRRIHLYDEKGDEVPGAFLELGEELWSPDGTRLTLLFDPGRIKQGLKPREELGPILSTGKSYALRIDHDWPDATGLPLDAPFVKPFKAGPADDTSPDPSTWKISIPSARSFQPLLVRFPEPLDAAMLRRVLRVRGPNGQLVPGEVSLLDGERLWHFKPETFWSPGRYDLDIDAELEDLAGNSIARPFEVDVQRPIEPLVIGESVALPFEVKAD